MEVIFGDARVKIKIGQLVLQVEIISEIRRLLK